MAVIVGGLFALVIAYGFVVKPLLDWLMHIREMGKQQMVIGPTTSEEDQEWLDDTEDEMRELSDLADGDMEMVIE